MSHEEWKGRLDTYLDGELATVEANEVDRHLRECSECAAEALRRMQWKRAIKSAGERYMAGERRFSLRPGAGRTASFRSPSTTTPFMFGLKWWPAAAMVLAVLVVGVGIQVSRYQVRSARNNQLIGELVDLHVSTLASTSPVDVVSTDRHTVKPWFAGKIPFSFDLPDLTGTPFELMGGRLSYLEQFPGAELLVRVRKHQISVFIFPDKAVPANLHLDGPMNAKSFQMNTFEKNGLRYFVIGDVASEDIQALANRLQNVNYHD